jgi:hypothetical protein
MKADYFLYFLSRVEDPDWLQCESGSRFRILVKFGSVFKQKELLFYKVLFFHLFFLDSISGCPKFWNPDPPYFVLFPQFFCREIGEEVVNANTNGSRTTLWSSRPQSVILLDSDTDHSLENGSLIKKEPGPCHLIQARRRKYCARYDGVKQNEVKQ